jgi:hypothetical protein
MSRDKKVQVEVLTYDMSCEISAMRFLACGAPFFMLHVTHAEFMCGRTLLRILCFRSGIK